MAAKKTRQPALEELPEGLVEEVASEIAAKRALPLRKLTTVKLARTAQAELEEKLIRAGFERTAKHMRVPLDEQLAALLANGDLVPLAGLARRLGGTAQAEAKGTAFDLAREGEIRLVVARGKDHLAASSAELVEPADVKTLRAAADALTKLLKKAAPKRGQPDRCLPKSEVRALVEPAARLTGGGPVTESGAAPAGRHRTIVHEALMHLGERDELVFVPALVRSLAERLTPEEVLSVLSQASIDGAVELRPESGIRTLNPDDAALCLPGPQGTLLSYARLLVRQGNPA